ncbi:MAG: hypothetical protein GWO82_06645 [Bacteroidetes bacterium]|nr:hypothetical protein [Bacteroidota bacterium]
MTSAKTRTIPKSSAPPPPPSSLTMCSILMSCMLLSCSLTTIIFAALFGWSFHNWRTTVNIEDCHLGKFHPIAISLTNFSSKNLAFVHINGQLYSTGNHKTVCEKEHAKYIPILDTDHGFRRRLVWCSYQAQIIWFDNPDAYSCHGIGYIVRDDPYLPPNPPQPSPPPPLHQPPPTSPSPPPAPPSAPANDQMMFDYIRDANDIDPDTGEERPMSLNNLTECRSKAQSSNLYCKCKFRCVEYSDVQVPFGPKRCNRITYLNECVYPWPGTDSVSTVPQTCEVGENPISPSYFSYNSMGGGGYNCLISTKPISWGTHWTTYDI